MLLVVLKKRPTEICHINCEMHCWLKPVSTCKLDDLFLISYNCIPPTPQSPPSQPSSPKLNGNSLQLDSNQSRYLSVSIAGGNKAIAFAAADKKTAFASWSTFERWEKWRWGWWRGVRDTCSITIGRETTLRSRSGRNEGTRIGIIPVESLPPYGTNWIAVLAYCVPRVCPRQLPLQTLEPI